MASVTRFLTRRLKLKVNTAKSAVGDVGERSFLGFSFTRGVRFRQLITELSRYLQGWRAYYGYCETPSVLRSMDGWIRRRLRAYLWHQWKYRQRRYRALRKLDVRHSLAAKLAGSGRGAWRISATPALCYALPNALFANLGLVSLAPEPSSSNPLNRRVRTRTHGGVGGWGP